MSDDAIRLSAELDVDGRKIPVSSFSLVLQENGIPVLSLSVGLSGAEADADKAVKVGFLDLVNSYRSVVAGAKTGSRKTATFSFSKTEAGDVKTVVLKEWLMDFASLSTVDAKGNFAVGMDLIHPAGALKGVFPGFFSRLPFKDPVDLGSPANLLVAVSDALSDAKTRAESSSGNPDHTSFVRYKAANCTVDAAPDDVGAKLLQRAVDAATRGIEILTTRFKWGAGNDGFPLLACMSAAVAGTVGSVSAEAGFLRYILSLIYAGDASDMLEFFKRFLNSCSVSIIPTYAEDELLCVPFAPWRSEPDFTIPDTDISRYSQPGDSSHELEGVYSSIDFASASTGAHIYLGPGGVPTQADVAFTGFFRDNPDVDGVVMSPNPPSWILGVMSAAAPRDREASVFPGGASIDGVGGGSADDPVESSVTREYALGMLYACSKDFFMSVYRQNDNIALASKLLLGGPSPLPGDVVRVASAGGGVVDFYATAVIHSADCAAGTAGTEISGAYARLPDDVPVEFGDGSNPLYAASETDYGAIAAKLEAEAGMTPTPSDLDLGIAKQVSEMTTAEQKQYFDEAVKLLNF